MKNLKPILVIFLVFSVVLVPLLQIKVVKAQETIYIKGDGSVEGTGLLQRNNNTYTFLDDISGNIVVSKDFITIDGAGFTLKGSGDSSQTGIDLTFKKNVTVKNLVITEYFIGIFCRPGAGTTTNITILGNYIHNCDIGIEFQGTSNNLIKYNTFKNNSIDISIAYVLGNNLITHNSIDSYIQVWMSDQPTIDMNYWTAYNGTDNDGDGIGDSAYYYHDILRDSHPLMEPVPVIPENNLTLFGFLFLGIIFLTMKLVYIRKEKNEKQ
jgi:parallel beta-helix repeat protein